jgi:hypothetical protein
LPLLRELRVVLLCGRAAQPGWTKHVALFIDDRLTMIEAWHLSPLAMRSDRQVGRAEGSNGSGRRYRGIGKKLTPS